jgi:hypothetical protein
MICCQWQCMKEEVGERGAWLGKTQPCRTCCWPVSELRLHCTMPEGPKAYFQGEQRGEPNPCNWHCTKGQTMVHVISYPTLLSRSVSCSMQAGSRMKFRWTQFKFIPRMKHLAIVLHLETGHFALLSQNRPIFWVTGLSWALFDCSIHYEYKERLWSCWTREYMGCNTAVCWRCGHFKKINSSTFDILGDCLDDFCQLR